LQPTWHAPISANWQQHLSRAAILTRAKYALYARKFAKPAQRNAANTTWNTAKPAQQHANAAPMLAPLWLQSNTLQRSIK
jgi:hypothetical protein